MKSKKYVNFLLYATLGIFLAVVLFKLVYDPMFQMYTGVENRTLTYDTSVPVTKAEFEKIAKEITEAERANFAKAALSNETDEFTKSLRKKTLKSVRTAQKGTKFKHIEYFREAGINQYEGPKTCLSCHETMKVEDQHGNIKTVDTMEDVLTSVHFQLHKMESGFSTYGYNGEEVNKEGKRPIPVGKIDRACGIPGSFSWTGWAKLVKSKPEHLHGEIELRSEGCGQCHIGGNYHPASESMMPVEGVPEVAAEGIDCLICHSQNYDMNYKYVIEDDGGTRWNQDRTMKAALSVTNPTSDNCLNCHQHNMGGDHYANNEAAKSLGYKNRRILHSGAKRGNPFHSSLDVHAKAGLQCTDCHVPQGHKIPRGKKGTDLVSNDLPDVEVSCEQCHTSAPHNENKKLRVVLNGHTSRLACETCHITELEENNLVLRDWVHPTWDEEEGMYVFTDLYKSGEVGKGFTFLWFNGNGTFLANALGSNPGDNAEYNILMDNITGIHSEEALAEIRANVEKLKEHYPELDVDEYMKDIENSLYQMPDELKAKREHIIETKLRPIAESGESKLYPFKIFNAMMFEDYANRGPFGAMILPFDYPTYYETGDPLKACEVASDNPIVRRMYQAPFKYYMMNDFMAYFGVDGWSTDYPFDEENRKNVNPRWMRQQGTLMVNHGIKEAEHARKCEECHSQNSIIPYEKLGYSEKRIEDLKNLPELKHFATTKMIETDEEIEN